MDKLGLVFLTLLALNALQEGKCVPLEEKNTIKEEERGVSGHGGGNRRHSHEHNHNHGHSHEHSDENIAPQLAAMFKYLYSTCKQKIEDSKLTLTKIAGGYYYFYTDSSGPALNWFQARDWCVSHGMKLADLETKAESDAVFARAYDILVNDNNNPWMYIGGNDLATEGTYRWSTGAAIDYINWLAGEPDGVNTDNCLDIFRGGSLGVEDGPCDDTGKFICELPNPCNDILLMVKTLKNSNHHHRSSSGYHANIIHRKRGDSDSDSDRDSESRQNSRSSSEETQYVKPGILSNVVNKIESHFKDKINFIGDKLGMIGDKFEKEELLPQITIIEQSRSSRSNDDHSHSTYENSRSTYENSRSTYENSRSTYENSRSTYENSRSNDDSTRESTEESSSASISVDTIETLSSDSDNDSDNDSSSSSSSSGDRPPWLESSGGSSLSL